MKKIIIFISTLLSITFLTGCSKWIDKGQSITAVGSTALQPLVETVAEEYQNNHPGQFVNVQGGGSGTGLSQVQSGAVNIGNSDVFAEEKSGINAKDLVDHQVAVVGITPIVNKKVGVKNISMENLQKIFTGEITNWNEVGGSDGEINVITREDGSGTRGAFTELFGIVDEDDNDIIIDTAEVTNSTSVMITTVTGNPNAIGYISLGALNDDVKAVQIDGVDATVDNINNGSYKISRPFNIATRDGLSEQAQDFINYILSDEGQAVIAEEGYISIESTGAYEPAGVSGDITIAGSSSVTPVMEALREAYIALNPDVNIEIQQSDSSTGMSNVADGLCDIGMASREVRDSELEKGLTPTVIALDGIAVIVNNENPITNLTSEDVYDNCNTIQSNNSWS